ncbi:MAG: carbohydrate ABC transporter permease [Clostridia bacterium]|nr:carbohydrate ABC transporter permease [Clostridia bacterium]
MKPIAHKHAGKVEKATAIIFWIAFFIIAFICIFPLFWAFNNSLKTFDEYGQNSFAITQSWSFSNYVEVFSSFEYDDVNYFGMLLNSLWIVVVKVVVNVASSAMLAYAIARFRFPGKDFLYVVVIFVNTIPIIGSGPAAFKLLDFLGMVENPLTIWIAWAGGFDFAFIVLYGYFKGVSPAYSEAAYIDGAGELRTFFTIILPQVIPCLVAIMITQAIGVWNDYGTVMIYLRESPNLAYGLYMYNTDSRYAENSKPVYFAAAVISAIPIIILYASTQNLILTNMTAGGLKG